MQEFNIDGKTYRCKPPSARGLQNLLDQSKTLLVDPVDELLETSSKLPESLRDKFIERHLDSAFERKKARGTLQDKDFHGWVTTPEGGLRMFRVVMSENYPNINQTEVDALFVRMCEEASAEVLAKETLREATHTPMSEAQVEQKFFRRSAPVAATTTAG